MELDSRGDSDRVVSCDWLAAHVSDSDVRVFDATIHLRRTGEVESGRADYLAGHVSGAGFLDHVSDLSDAESSVSYTRLAPEQLAAAFARAGVSDDSRVVVYSSSHVMWATRAFWLLRGIGFDRVSVLDGGLADWKKRDLPVSADPCAYTAGRLSIRPRAEVWADRDEVLAAIGNRGVCTINALPRALHRGEAEMHYGRRGHVSGSDNVPFTAVVDAETGCFEQPAAWRAAFDAVGVFDRERAITYCGGGISATVDAFALLALGHPNVAVYDGSLLEWGSDATLPMETGD